MSGFDLVIIVIFVISVVVAFWRGFVKEAFSIGSWIVAFWLGNAFCNEAGEFIGQYINIPTETFRIWIGFAAVFVLTLMAAGLLNMVVSKLFLHGPIKTLDRFLGVVFGGVRAAAIVIVIMLVARGFGLDQSAWWQNSTYLPKFLPAADFIHDEIMPESLKRDSIEENSIQQQVIDGVIKPQLPTEVTEPAEGAG